MLCENPRALQTFNHNNVTEEILGCLKKCTERLEHITSLMLCSTRNQHHRKSNDLLYTVYGDKTVAEEEFVANVKFDFSVAFLP